MFEIQRVSVLFRVVFVEIYCSLLLFVGFFISQTAYGATICF